MNRHATILALLVLIVLAPATGGTQTRDAPLVEGQRTLRVQREHYGTLAPDHPTVTRVRSNVLGSGLKTACRASSELRLESRFMPSTTPLNASNFR